MLTELEKQLVEALLPLVIERSTLFSPEDVEGYVIVLNETITHGTPDFTGQDIVRAQSALAAAREKEQEK